MSDTKPAACKAITSKGKHCTKLPLEGGKYCFRHCLTRVKDIPWWLHPITHVSVVVVIGALVFGLPLLIERHGAVIGIQPPGPEGVYVIEQQLQKTQASQQTYLDERYRDGHAVLGVSKTGFCLAHAEEIKAMGSLPSHLKVHWSTGSVVEITQTRVRIRLPDLMDTRSHRITMGPLVSIRKEKGFRLPVWEQSEQNIFLEVLEVYDNFVTVGLGIGLEDEQ